MLAQKQHIAWAENSLATMWGTLPDQDIHLSFDGMDEMRKAEAHLCELEPRSVRTAREMLKVAIEICAYEGIDPEHTMAQGPVLGIVRNVTKALDNLDGDTPLGGPRAAT